MKDKWKLLWQKAGDVVLGCCCSKANSKTKQKKKEKKEEKTEAIIIFYFLPESFYSLTLPRQHLPKALPAQYLDISRNGDGASGVVFPNEIITLLESNVNTCNCT